MQMACQQIQCQIMAADCDCHAFYRFTRAQKLNAHLRPGVQPFRKARYFHDAVGANQRHNHARPPLYRRGDQPITHAPQTHAHEFVFAHRRKRLARYGGVHHGTRRARHAQSTIEQRLHEKFAGQRRRYRIARYAQQRRFVRAYYA